MQVLLVLTAAASFAGAVALPLLYPLPPAAHIHLALAAGVMPLIFSAMIHFVPVLTRSAIAPLGVRLISLLMLIAGLLGFFSFAANSPIILSCCIHRVRCSDGIRYLDHPACRVTVGRPHPCLDWYLGAIASLIMALAAVFAMALWPEQRLALKSLHLHLNTLGFIGLTAIATLQVLLPTVAGRPDLRPARDCIAI